MDPQCIVQRSVERSTVAAQLLPQLLLLLSVDEEGGWRVDALLLLPRVRCWTARARGAAWDEEASTPCLKPPATMRPSHRLTSAPPEARGLAREDFPTGPTQAAGCRRRESPSPSPGSCRRGWAPAAARQPRRRLRYHSCGLPLWRGDFRLRLRLNGRGRLMRLHGRRRRQRHYDWRRWLRPRHRLCLSHGWPLSHLCRRLPRLHGRRGRSRPRGLGRAS
jgi:hypothetical protein